MKYNFNTFIHTVDLDPRPCENLEKINPSGSSQTNSAQEQRDIQVTVSDALRPSSVHPPSPETLDQEEGEEEETDDTMGVKSETDDHMQYSLEEDDHVETVVLDDTARSEHLLSRYLLFSGRVVWKLDTG